MKYRSLGKSGIEASVVGFGAWAIGGWMWGGTKRNDPQGAIRAAVDHGINLIDTAPMYGARDVDQAIANAKAGEVELTEEEIWTIRKAVDQTKL
jgi:methylglyoxal reductase